VLMIVIVTTISVYLAVYKGVPLEQHDDDDTEKSKKKKSALRRLTRRARKTAPDAPEPGAEASGQDSASKSAAP